MTDQKKRESPWDEWDGEYIGNMWGWKFSFISLGVILFFIGLFLYRYWTIPEEDWKNYQNRTHIEEVDTSGTKVEQ